MKARKIETIALTAFLILNLLIIVNPPISELVSGAGAPPDNEGQTNYGGNWDITSYTYRGNQTIILTGNLTIESGGNLVFRNVTLKFNSYIHNDFSLQVQNGGEFHIYDDSKVTLNNTAGNPSYFFWVEPNGTLEITNSEVAYCGNGTGTGTRNNFRDAGLYTESANIIISDSLITKGSFGLIIDNSSFDGLNSLNNVDITDSIVGFYSNVSAGVISGLDFFNCSTAMIIAGADNTVNGVTVTGSNSNGIITFGNNTRVLNTIFRNSNISLQLNNSYGYVNNCDFYDSNYGVLSYGNRTIVRLSDFWNMSYAVYISGNNTTVEDCKITNVSSEAVYIKGALARLYRTQITDSKNSVVFKDVTTPGFNTSIDINYTTIWYTLNNGMVLDASIVSVNNSVILESVIGINITSKAFGAVVNNSYIDKASQTGIRFEAQNASVVGTTVQFSGTGILFMGANSTSSANSIFNCTYGINTSADNTRITAGTLFKGCNEPIEQLNGLSGFVLRDSVILQAKNSTVRLNGTRDTTVLNTTFNSNVFSLWLSGTDNTTLAFNRFIGNGPGMVLNGTVVTEISNNTFTGYTSGMFLNNTNDTQIWNNTFTSNGFGLLLAGFDTTIEGNTFNNPGYDLNLTGNNRTSTQVVHNNFYTGIIAAANASVWTLGYPEGGNYYDWSGLVDLNSTVGQNVSGPDGLMDSAYLFNTSYNDIDSYPLALPWPINRLPQADNFSFKVNVSVSPMAVMFIANGSDLEDSELNLTPIFEYRAPNGTWENTSISLVRYITGTWYANLTHPLNGSKGWYDIRVRFMDRGGYHGNVIQLNKTFYIPTEKPVALTFNASTYSIFRTNTLSIQLNGSDPDESEFNLTPFIELRRQSNITWFPSSFWDVSYVFVNYSGSDPGNYTRGYWKMNITPGKNMPAGVYDVRFRFNDTDYDFSDWFYHNQGLTIKNNLPVFQNLSVSIQFVNRTETMMLSTDASDIEDELWNLTAVIQYRAPSGAWTDLTNEEYNASQGKWTASFTPNASFELGLYDFRVEFRDKDDDSTGWTQLDDVLTVDNNIPLLTGIAFSSNAVNRTHYMYIYLEGSDVENLEGNLVPELEYRAPSGGAWIPITTIEYINTSWRANFTFGAGFELDWYDFRARFSDLEVVPGVSPWLEALGTVLAVNNVPVGTEFDISELDILRGENTSVYFKGIDAEDDGSILFAEFEYRHINGLWSTLGIGLYDSVNGSWSMEFSPGPSYSLGLYHFRARLTDSDDGTGNWLEVFNLVFVSNNLPVINTIGLSNNTIFRNDPVTVFLNAMDYEDAAEDYILRELQMRGPDSPLWESLPGLLIINGRWELTLVLDQNRPLGGYDFRALILDSDGNSSDWFELDDGLFVLNRLPRLELFLVTPINGTENTVFNFTVDYFEFEGELPVRIELFVGTHTFIPFELNKFDTDPSDGKLYYYETKLSKGVYSYFFSAEDAYNGTAKSILNTGLVVEEVVIILDPGGIKGRVVDDISGNGVPQAFIYYSLTLIKFDKITTDSDGYFKIESLKVGRYSIYAASLGYDTGSLEAVEVETEKTTVLTIVLRREVSPDADKYKVGIFLPKKELVLSENMTIEASVTEAGGKPLEDDSKLIYRWDFGDGTEIGVGKSIVHNYSLEGEYNITLTVLDDKGVLDIVITSVNVKPGVIVPDDKDDPQPKKDDGDDAGDLKLILFGILGAVITGVIILVVLIFSMLMRMRRLIKPKPGARGPEPEDEPKPELVARSPEPEVEPEPEAEVTPIPVALPAEPEPESEARDPEPDVETEVEHIEDDDIDEDDIKIIIEEY